MKTALALIVLALLPLGAFAEDFDWNFGKYITTDEDSGSVFITDGQKTYLGSVVDRDDGTFWAMGNGGSIFGTRCGDQYIILNPTWK